MTVKKILAAALVVVLLVGMAACGVSKEDVTGVWKRETLYIAYYGCDTDMIVSFAEDGSFVAMLLDHETNNMLNYAGGTWTLQGGTVLATDEQNVSGTMEFTYDSRTDTIENEGYTFTRSE